jgi:hypothetical protein
VADKIEAARRKGRVASAIAMNLRSFSEGAVGRVHQRIGAGPGAMKK